MAVTLVYCEINKQKLYLRLGDLSYGGKNSTKVQRQQSVDRSSSELYAV